MSSCKNKSDTSPVSAVEQKYWTTKEVVLKKIGKQNDDCIIASDSELDAKLEFFKTTTELTTTLMNVLKDYNDKLSVLAREEDAFAQFLIENGRVQTRKVTMGRAGESFAYCAKQRLSLKTPVVRLYEELQTFQNRACVDISKTIEKMEKTRTIYRGSLRWMKEVSQQLNPDACKQMEKFRKIQNQVRKSKLAFDNLKLDTTQKLDLLSLSRCNIFSKTLAIYQDTLQNVFLKIATSSYFATQIEVNPPYILPLLKKAAVMKKKLSKREPNWKFFGVDNEHTASFLDTNYCNNVDCSVIEKDNERKTNAQNYNKLSNRRNNKNSREETLKNNRASEKIDNDLINFDDENPKHNSMINQQFSIYESEKKSSASEAILVYLDETQSSSKLSGSESLVGIIPRSLPNFYPSQLLDMNVKFKDTKTNSEEMKNEMHEAQICNYDNKCSIIKQTRKDKQNKPAWLKYLADLDQFENSDLIGKNDDQTNDSTLLC